MFLFKTVLLLLCCISAFSDKIHELHVEIEVTSDEVVVMTAKNKSSEVGKPYHEDPRPQKISDVQQARQNLTDIVVLGSRKYFFSMKQVGNWFHASIYCNLLGMALVSIETKEENDLIMEHVEKLGKTREWILTGGNKIGHNDYAWISGAPMTFQDWNRGDPASFKTEHCLMLHKGHWSDLGCHSWHVRFICEQV